MRILAINLIAIFLAWQPEYKTKAQQPVKSNELISVQDSTEQSQITGDAVVLDETAQLTAPVKSKEHIIAFVVRCMLGF